MNKLQFTGEYYVPKITPLRIEADHLARYRFAIQFVKNKVVLDAACGTGYGSYAISLGQAKKIIGIDLNREVLNYAKKNYQCPNLTFLKQDVVSLKSKNKFDVIISFETIEHVPNPQKVINNFYNSLRADGVLVLSTPNRDITSPGKNFSDQPNNKYHKQEFTLSEFDKFLKNAGFQKINYFGQRLRFFFSNQILAALYEKFINPDNKSSPECLKFKYKTPRYIIAVATKNAMSLGPNLL